MKNKNQKTIEKLVIVLAVQIILLVLVNVFSFSNVKSRELNRPLFKGISKQNIVEFELNDRIDGFKAYKQSGEWFIEYEGRKLPADIDMINNYLEVIGNLKEGFTVYTGTDAAQDDSYGLGSQTVQNLRIKNNKSKEFKLEIGSVGSRRGTTYVRKSGENAVRQIDSPLKSSSVQLYKDWTDRRIVSDVKLEEFKSARIDLNLEMYKADYTIVSVDGGNYQIIPESENRELDQAEVRLFVNRLAALKADNHKIYGELGNEALLGTIQLEFKNKNYILEFYPAGEEDLGNFIVKSSNSPYLFLYHQDTLEKLLKRRDEFYKL